MALVQSTIPAVKAKLKTMAQARAGLSGIQVEYGDAGQFARSEGIRLGPTDIASQDNVSMRSDIRSMRETYVVHVLCESTRRTPELAETRAMALAGEITDMIARDSTLESTTYVLWAVVSGMELDTDEGPEQTRTVVDIEITVVADLARS